MNEIITNKSLKSELYIKNRINQMLYSLGKTISNIIFRDDVMSI